MHPIHSPLEAVALKSTIDLTLNDYISVFEFDIFARCVDNIVSLSLLWSEMMDVYPSCIPYIGYISTHENSHVSNIQFWIRGHV